LHAKLEYTNKNLNISLDGRNLTDKDHTNRGFWFGKYGNDPRKFYAPEPYTQLGAPRLISLSVKYNF
jgi:iron complex outermembrane receptor protein